MPKVIIESLALLVSLGAAAARADVESLNTGDVSFLIRPGPRSVHVKGQGRRPDLLPREVFTFFEDFVKRGHPGLTVIAGSIDSHVLRPTTVWRVILDRHIARRHTG